RGQVGVVALVLAELDVEGLEKLAVLLLGADDLDVVVQLGAEQLQRLLVDRLRGRHHLAEVQHDLHQRGGVGPDPVGEVGQRRTARQADRRAVAAGDLHTADRRRRHVVELLAPLTLGLAATRGTATGTPEGTRRAAAATATTAGTAAEASGTAARTRAAAATGTAGEAAGTPAATAGTATAARTAATATTGTAGTSARRRGTALRHHHRVRARTTGTRTARTGARTRAAGAGTRTRAGRTGRTRTRAGSGPVAAALRRTRDRAVTRRTTGTIAARTATGTRTGLAHAARGRRER